MQIHPEKSFAPRKSVHPVHRGHTAGRAVDILVRVPLVKGRPLHTNQDRHDTDDCTENFIQVIETDNGLRDLQ